MRAAQRQDKFYELTEALSTLAYAHPFIACLLFDKLILRVEEQTEIPTAGTDGIEVIINKDFFLSLTKEQRVFVIAHEVMHAMLCHPTRMKRYSQIGLHGQTFLPMLYNIAADYVINATLVNDYIGEIKKEWLYDERITAGELVEDVYKRLLEQLPPSPSNDDSDDSDGDGDGDGDGSDDSDTDEGDETEDDSSGGGGGGGGGGTDEGDDASSGSGNPRVPAAPNAQQFDYHMLPPKDIDVQHSEIEWKAAVQAAVIGAKAIGRMPASMERLVDGFLYPERDWREVLSDFIRVRAGFDQRNWRRPNRRKLFSNRIYVPTRHTYVLDCVAIIIDTSGSVGEKEVNTFLGAVAEILEQCMPREMRVLSVDAAVHHEAVFSHPAELTGYCPVGGGGTDMEAGFRYLNEAGVEPDVCLVLTDGYTYTHEQNAPYFPVVWVTTGNTELAYGSVVSLNVE
jgi:predicted metal-dependent peptidase